MNGLTKSEWYTLGGGIIIIIIIICIMAFGNKPSGLTATQTAPQASSSTQTPMDQIQQTPANAANISQDSNIKIYDLQIGTGTVAQNGDVVTVNYVGALTNGTKFDSSYDHGQPFSFTLGSGQVIKGWEIGVQGMKVGGTRQLVISPSYGYGNHAVGSIPANSTLLFDVTLLSVKKGS